MSQVDLKMDSDSGKFSGYASVFGGIDSYGDTIVKGAYEYTLKKHGKPKMFIQHDSSGLPVGKWLSAKEDDHGLYVEGELTLGMSKSQDALAALKHGTVDGLSIGYMLKAGDYEDLADGNRIIKRITQLAEVSIVTYPADGAARIDLVKSADIEAMSSIKEFERLLRDVGAFDRQSAKHLIAKAKELFNKREAEDDPSKTAVEARVLALAIKHS